MKRIFDRSLIRAKPLSERVNKLDIERDSVDPASYAGTLSPSRPRPTPPRPPARPARPVPGGAPVILAFGAHSIKNGLSRLMIRLLGAGLGHPFRHQRRGDHPRLGVRLPGPVRRGREALRSRRAVRHLGRDRLLPQPCPCHRRLAGSGLRRVRRRPGGRGGPSHPIRHGARGRRASWSRGRRPDESILSKAAAAADLRALLLSVPLPAGFLRVEHPWARYCLSAAAWKAGVPFTCHPMFGHDIIYTHPANRGAPIGRTAEPDFLSFVDSVSRLEGGVYLSVGSAVMSPMIFEKALSMARNAAGTASKKPSRTSPSTSWTWPPRPGTGPRTESRLRTTPPTTCVSARPSAAWAGG